jgi:hypothetical protein
VLDYLHLAGKREMYKKFTSLLADRKLPLPFCYFAMLLNALVWTQLETWGIRKMWNNSGRLGRNCSKAIFAVNVGVEESGPAGDKGSWSCNLYYKLCCFVMVVLGKSYLSEKLKYLSWCFGWNNETDQWKWHR